MAMNSPRRNKRGPVSDINVTPLVDVMLVLLVIFMVTAPLMLNGIKLELPKTKEVNKLNVSTEQVVLSLDKDANLFLGEAAIGIADVVNKVKSEFTRLSTDTVYLRGDYYLNYGRMAELISVLKAAGILKVALITQIDKHADPTKPEDKNGASTSKK